VTDFCCLKITNINNCNEESARKRTPKKLSRMGENRHKKAREKTDTQKEIKPDG